MSLKIRRTKRTSSGSELSRVWWRRCERCRHGLTLRCGLKVFLSMWLQFGLMLRRGLEVPRSPTLQHGLMLRCGLVVLRSLTIQQA